MTMGLPGSPLEKQYVLDMSYYEPYYREQIKQLLMLNVDFDAICRLAIGLMNMVGSASGRDLDWAVTMVIERSITFESFEETLSRYGRGVRDFVEIRRVLIETICTMIVNLQETIGKLGYVSPQFTTYAPLIESGTVVMEISVNGYHSRS